MLACIPVSSLAVALTSTHYRLDPNVGDTFGGTGSSTSYKLTDAGGEGVVGSGASQSYKLTQGYVSQLIHSITLSVLPNGTVAYYPLDSGTGTVAYDVSTNSNNGYMTATPGWVAGKLNKGISLNGSSQYVDVPTNSSLNLTGDLTIEGWVNLTDYANNATIAAKTTGNGAANNTYEFRVQQTTGKLQFLGFDTALQTVTSSAVVPTGSFVHVAVTKLSGTVTLYINGSPSGSGSVSTTTSNSNNLKLGVRDDLANFFKGSLDEVKLYNRGLSATEITNDYLAPASNASSAFTLPNVTPGISQNYSADAVVRTDAGGYDLYIQENHDLTHTDNVTTIPPMSGTITLPTAWSEGTTKGLGFAVTSGTQVEAKWGTNPNYDYAAIPTTATIFHSRIGLNGGTPEKTTVQYRVDTTQAQKSGTYTNIVIYTATIKP